MDKDILVQYCEMKEEIKDLRQRIMKLDKFLQDPPITVTGSRKDLTIGPIKVTGIPDPIYRRKQAARERYKKLLELKEAELLELTTQAEEYIDSIPKSELRIMFRLYFIDGLSDAKVADRMNWIFPNRNKKYTDEQYDFLYSFKEIILITVLLSCAGQWQSTSWLSYCLNKIPPTHGSGR